MAIVDILNSVYPYLHRFELIIKFTLIQTHLGQISVNKSNGTIATQFKLLMTLAQGIKQLLALLSLKTLVIPNDQGRAIVAPHPNNGLEFS